MQSKMVFNVFNFMEKYIGPKRIIDSAPILTVYSPSARFVSYIDVAGPALFLCISVNVAKHVILQKNYVLLFPSLTNH